MLTTHQRIDALLKTRHMSRRQLAIKAGIPEGTLAGSFARGTQLKLEVIQRIAAVLNVDWIALAGYGPARKADAHADPFLEAALNDLRTSIDRVLSVIADAKCMNEEIPTPDISRNGAQ